MFEFLNMINNYEERKVARFEEGDLIIDTCLVTDSMRPYETAVQHPSYNRGDWIIVEGYESIEEAQTGHDRWVKIMTSQELPKELVDVSTFVMAKMLDNLDDRWRSFKKED